MLYKSQPLLLGSGMSPAHCLHVVRMATCFQADPAHLPCVLDVAAGSLTLSNEQ